MKKFKKEKKLPRKIKRFFNSFKPILVALIILVVILIVYSNNITKSVKVYKFNGSSDYVVINNGIISLNFDVNVLEGSDIDYKKDKDIVVTDYKIGYYVKDGDNLLSLVVIEDADPEGFSLKALLEGISAFNVTELSKNNKHFSKEKIELLNNGLYFVIEATDKKGNSLVDITNLDLVKLTK